MVKHIVMWKYKDTVQDEDKPELVARLKTAAEAMNGGKIPGLIKAALEVSVNPNETHDLALYCEFEDLKSVEEYQDNPIHVAFKNIIVPNVCGRACIDCEDA
ncbi:MAG: Dabb family protein [Clostridia bacterium]|nr:Dabb family protein [Clostridia bacterium]